MSGSYDCILGQLYGCYTHGLNTLFPVRSFFFGFPQKTGFKYGFHIVNDLRSIALMPNRTESFAYLTELWKAELPPPRVL